MNKSLTEEKKLLHRIKDGNESAFHEFFENHHKAVYHLYFHMLHDLHKAEDITQEVFLKAFMRVDKFRGESKVSTWLYRIAVNLCLNHQRQKKHKNILSLDFMFERRNQQARDPGNGPLERLNQKEEKLIVRETIDSLPKNQRIAIIFNHYEGFSYHEISEIMNLSVSSVRSLIYRAKQRLQKRMIS